MLRSPSSCLVCPHDDSSRILEARRRFLSPKCVIQHAISLARSREGSKKNLKMGLCCFRGCPGRAKTSPNDPDVEEEGWSVDSEPYSPQNLDYLKTVVATGKTEEAKTPGCPPSSNSQGIIVQGQGENPHTIEPVSSLTAGITSESMLSKHPESKDVTEIPTESNRPSMLSANSSDCVSPADTQKTQVQKAGSASVPSDSSSRFMLRSVAIFERKKSFRWEHAYYDNEEPLFRTENIDFSRTGRSAPTRNSISPTIAKGQRKLHMNGQTSSDINEESKSVLGWCIQVSRTGQCILNHHQLRPIMDELKHWSMQVPGTVSIRYKHTSGLDAFLPWPDLRTGSKQEIQEFVEAVNRIEKRTVFNHVTMERARDKSFPSYTSPSGCFPPPSPTSVTKPGCT